MSGNIIRAERIEKYLRAIARAETDTELDNIVEMAAWDDDITHAEYAEVYNKALVAYWEAVS